MHQPKHRATRVPTARRRAATLGTAAFGAVVVGASTLTGGVAQAAQTSVAVAFTAPVGAAVPALSAVPAVAPVPTSALSALASVSHPMTVVVAARRTSPATSAVLRRVVAAAASRRGTPYRYGAAGPRAFDCSGLTKWSYAQVGKRIPRTAAEQYRASYKVPKSAKRPGDLIFYISNGRVYHAGVYAGNNQAWVARGSGTRIGLQTIYSSNYAVGRYV